MMSPCLDDSGQVGSGDLEGYHGGTVAAPVQERDQATIITVAGTFVDGVDFGLGPLP